MTTQQVETAVAAGTVTGTGNATVIVTARDIPSSPVTLSVGVTSGDTASIVGGLIRTALAFNAAVAAQFLTSGSGANVVLTSHLARANDTTLNVSIDNGTCTGLTAALTSTNTTAGDGLENAYCTLADMKDTDVLKFPDTSHDAMLTLAINDASRQIDKWTGRRFFTALETRYYTPEYSNCLTVHDIANTTSFALLTDENDDGTYENTWTTSDYDLAPYNAELDDEPYTEIQVKGQASFSFPRRRKAAKVTAYFGYPNVPQQVHRVCILQAERVFKRYMTVFGIAGATAIGTVNMKIPTLDDDVAKPLMNLVRYD